MRHSVPDWIPEDLANEALRRAILRQDDERELRETHLPRTELEVIAAEVDVPPEMVEEEVRRLLGGVTASVASREARESCAQASHSRGDSGVAALVQLAVLVIVLCMVMGPVSLQMSAVRQNTYLLAMKNSLVSMISAQEVHFWEEGALATQVEDLEGYVPTSDTKVVLSQVGDAGY